MSPLAASALDHFAELAECIVGAEREAREAARKSHANFNVFTTLLSPHDEVRLHTRFLHGLLNPRGGHDCGALFLDLFFATLADLPPASHDDNPTEVSLPPGPRTWAIARETRCGDHGQIDLLLTSAGCGIAIENKIYAVEQHRQIASYHDYVAGACPNSARVLYLTLDGKSSDTAEGRPYLRISYQRHILDWLDRCLAATLDMPPIFQVLRQYREVVRSITGLTLDTPHMKPAIEFIRQNPEVIASLPQIHAAIAEVRADFLDQIAAGLIEGLSPEFQVALRPRLTQNRFGKDANGALVIKLPPGSPLARFEVWVEHIAKLQDALVVGIETAYDKPPLSAEDQTLLARMDRLLAEYTEHHKADPRATWGQTWWPTGSHDLIYPFDDQKLAALLKSSFAAFIEDLCAKVRAHIRVLEEVCVLAMNEAKLAPASHAPDRMVGA